MDPSVAALPKDHTLSFFCTRCNLHSLNKDAKMPSLRLNDVAHRQVQHIVTSAKKRKDKGKRKVEGLDMEIELTA